MGPRNGPISTFRIFQHVILVLLLLSFTAKAIEIDVSAYMPELKPWMHVKRSERSDMDGSEVPRLPILLYERNVSAGIDPVIATPLIDDGKLFIADSGGIYALNASNGELIWGVDITSQKHAVGGSTVDLEKSKRERQGWDVSKWRFAELGTSVSYFGCGIGNNVYIATTSTHRIATGDYEEPVILAIDKETGEILWTQKFGVAGGSASGNLVVHNGFVCSGSSDSQVYCFSEIGALAWKAKLEGGSPIGLAGENGILYVSTPGTADEKASLHAFKIENGEILWKFTPEYGGMSAPVVKNGMVFFVGSGRLYALSEKGQLLWEKNLGIGGDLYDNPFVAVGDRWILAVRNIGERPLDLYVLDFNGNILGSFKMENSGEMPAGAPVNAGNVVLMPVVSYGEIPYAKIYFLWKGTVKLHEITFYGTEIGRPGVSSAYGDVYAVWWTGEVRDAKNRLTVFGDREKPVIGEVTDVKTAFENEDVKINATIWDENSGIYRAVMFYRVNGSSWKAIDMFPERRYVMEPVGGYGFTEEPFSANIPSQPAGSFVEYVVFAVDNTGNYAFSDVKSYEVAGARETGTPLKIETSEKKTEGFELLLAVISNNFCHWIEKKAVNFVK